MLSFKDLYNTILTVIFTKRCRFCKNICSITDTVCDSCAEDISGIEGDICFSCGCSKLICNCNKKFHYYESVCAPYYYEGAAQKAVVSLKSKITPRISDALSDDMSKCVEHHYKHLFFDYCTFVPMHSDDENKRGFNQSKILAENVAKTLEIPFAELIKKDFKTKSQHKLPEAMRYGNLSGAFSFNKFCNLDLTDKRILICDDIKTTGATLDECTKILLFAGAAEVRCVSACITKPLEKQTK